MQVAHDGSYRLQMRHVDVEVHPVDRLELEHDMITQHIRHRSCYAHRGLRSSTGPRTHRALRAPISRACPCRLDRSPPPSTVIHRYFSPMRLLVWAPAEHHPPKGSASDRRGMLPSIHTKTRLVGLRRSLVSSTVEYLKRTVPRAEAWPPV